MLLVPEALDDLLADCLDDVERMLHGNLLSASGGNVLAQIRGRSDNLSLAHIVVGQEDDLEEVADITVVVHHGSDGVDQMNNLLRHPVAGSSLASEDGDTRDNLLSLLRRQGLQSEVSMNDTKDVELLALVLMDSLDLHVEKRRWVHSNAGGSLDELSKSYLVGVLDLGPLLAEFLILSILLELVESCQVLEETIAATLGRDELREARVGLVEPAARGDTVGHVGELVRAIDLDKVLEDGGLDEV